MIFLFFLAEIKQNENVRVSRLEKDKQKMIYNFRWCKRSTRTSKTKNEVHVKITPPPLSKFSQTSLSFLKTLTSVFKELVKNLFYDIFYINFMGNKKNCQNIFFFFFHKNFF